jgi:hypothetical protein
MISLDCAALQKAIYEKLTGNSPLMAQVSGIFDQPPQGTLFPYVTIGDMIASEVSNLAVGGADYKFNIHIWSREAGHKQTADILKTIYELLHHGNISVAGQTLTVMQVISSSILLENDGITYHGEVRLQVILVADS